MKVLKRKWWWKSCCIITIISGDCGETKIESPLGFHNESSRDPRRAK
jgi:hypothetical protein